ncbi:hypothetical protein V6N11_031287 [Hibiscus sabdariffa]|uniref:Secreted protein n=1 Tax=Hibiscus sabdariffa TaxID=183260 RepID=A0ABR2SY22_9ROSI
MLPFSPSLLVLYRRDCCAPRLTIVCNRDRGLGAVIVSFCRDLSHRHLAIHGSCYVICRGLSLQQAAVRDCLSFPTAKYVQLYFCSILSPVAIVSV